jgi:hypothetical protein
MIKVNKSKDNQQVCTITIDSSYIETKNFEADSVSISLNASELHDFITNLMGVLENRLQSEKPPATVASRAAKAYSNNS